MSVASSASVFSRYWRSSAEIHFACSGRSSMLTSQTSNHRNGKAPSTIKSTRQFQCVSSHPESGDEITTESGKHNIQ